MNHYLVTVSSRTENIERFLDSLKHIDIVDHISIQFDPVWDKDKAWRIYNVKYPNNTERYRYIPYIKENGYVIFTDTDDVIFQQDFPDFEALGYDIYVGNERILHRDTIWKGIIEDLGDYECLLDRTVYNAGAYAMRTHIFNEWIDYITHQSISRWNEDQLIFNKFLYLNKYTIHDPRHLFCPLYSNYDDDRVDKIENIWMTRRGKVITCIHENGKKNRI